MKRTTQASPPRSVRHSDLRTQSEYALVMPEQHSGSARSAPPSPRPGQRPTDRLGKARAIERRLADEVRQRGGPMPRRTAIEHYLRAMAEERPRFRAADAEEVLYLHKLGQELAQEVGPTPQLLYKDLDGTWRPWARLRARELLLQRWDRWPSDPLRQHPDMGPYLAQACARLAKGITHRKTVDLEDWPMESDANHAMLHSLIEQVIEPAMNDMEWEDLDKREVGLVVRLPTQLRGRSTPVGSAAGHHAEQPPVGLVGEQVQQPVGAFAHIPDAGIDVGQEPLLPHEPALFEHQP